MRIFQNQISAKNNHGLDEFTNITERRIRMCLSMHLILLQVKITYIIQQQTVAVITRVRCNLQNNKELAKDSNRGSIAA